MNLGWIVIWPIKQKRISSIYRERKEVVHTTKSSKGKVAQALAKKKAKP
jgi:hypothetical protein